MSFQNDVAIPRPEIICGLQVLRGVAATLVAGFHLYKAALNEGFDPGPFWLFRHGEAGVDLFFVLSGFIIYHVSVNSASAGLRGFATARFWRILPPYWSILVLYIGAFALKSFLFGEGDMFPSVGTLATSVFLLPSSNQVINIAWTLSLEMVFYIIFAATFFRGGNRPFFIAMALWALSAQFFLHFVTHKSPSLLIVLNTVVVEFLFGSIIGYAYKNHAPRYQVAAFFAGLVWMIAAIVLDFSLVSGAGREISFGLPAALIVYALAGLRRSLSKVLVTWGESSYILYLSHVLFFMLLGKPIEMVFHVNPYSSSMIMSGLLGTAILLAYLANVYLERPYQRWYKSRIRRRAVTSAA